MSHPPLEERIAALKNLVCEENTQDFAGYE